MKEKEVCDTIKKTLFPVRATLIETKKGKIILHLSIHSRDIQRFCLEPGKQPSELFEIIVHERGEIVV